MLTRYRRIALIARLAMTGALVAACSSAGAPSAARVDEVTPAPTASPTVAPTPASPTVAPTPAPTPEPTPDLAAIGAAYLAIADILTTKGQPAVDAIAQGGSFTPDEWGDMHQAAADVYEEAIAELDKIEFPDDLADEIKAIRAHWVDARELFAEVADDPSIDNWDEFVATATAYGKVGDAIRTYLGLPPRPTPPPD